MKISAACLAFLLLTLLAAATAWADLPTDFPASQVAENRYIVQKHAAAQTRELLSRTLAPRAAALGRELGQGSGMFVVTRGSAPERGEPLAVVDYNPGDTFCDSLLQSGTVEACSPDFRRSVSAVPNDPNYSTAWWYHGANSVAAESAWNYTQGSSDVVVAIIDTGVDYTHPDLVDNMWHNPWEVAGNGLDDDNDGYVDDVYGFNAYANNGNPMDGYGHGTHVAGIIGARGNNSLGVVGVNWNVKLMALKFLSDEGYGWDSDAIEAINYLIAMKRRGVNVRAVNNSWGGYGQSQALYNAIKAAGDEGIIFVCAAGNSSGNSDVLAATPAAFDLPNIVSVAATSSLGEISSYSNFGAVSVDIAAPGDSILSTVPGPAYAQYSGTSMATPFVTGALGLLQARQPLLSSTEMITRLFATAERRAALDGYVATSGLLNLTNLITDYRPPAVRHDAACSYTPENIPFNPDHSVESQALSAPSCPTCGWWSNFSYTLPFDFPFYADTVRRVSAAPTARCS